MSKLAFLSSGAGVTAGAGAVVVGVAATVGYMSGAFTPEAAIPAVQPAVSAAPAAQPVQEAETTLAPSFDVVRVAPDGQAMIAGQAEPGATVSIRLDSDVVAEAQAGNDGSFASLVMLDADTEPRVMSLSSDQGAQSTQQVIIAPVASGPVAAAPDTPQPQAETIADAPEAGAAPTPPQAPAVLLADDAGVRVLQAPQTDAMTALLSTISYDARGDVALTGRSDASFVRVYLDNAPVTTSRIEVGGDWRADLPDVDTGIYTLRVDELDAQGDVLARVETPFQREEPDTLRAAQTGGRAIEAITVQPGATLWAIARDTYGDGTLYTRLFDANRDSIRDPDMIFPGQVFSLPN